MKLVASGIKRYHTTACEALQALEVALGVERIPPHLRPYIFWQGETPNTLTLKRVLAGGVDVFLLEIVSSQQFFCENVPLPDGLVSRKLVRPHGNALLRWYREVCLRGAADEATVLAALESLPTGEAEKDDLAYFLRAIRMVRQGADEIAASLRTLMSMAPGLWVVVGPFYIASEEGALMTARKVLMADLKEAARRAGAISYDPSELIEQFGRETVLRGQGTLIHHYSDEFLPTAGAALMDAVRQALASGPAAGAAEIPGAAPNAFIGAP